MNVTRWAWVAIGSAAAVLVVVVGSFAVFGNSSASTIVIRPGGPGGGVATAVPQPVLVSDADIEFVTGMIPHHQQALEMIDLLEAGVSEGNTFALSERMRLAQTGELEFLEAWKTRHADLVTGHDHSHAAGMASQAELDDLASRSGVAAERAFLQLMIRHHRGAVDMATARLTESGAGAITEYAQNVFADQSAEIVRMEGLLRQLGG